jgi:hypothetical protein
MRGHRAAGSALVFVRKGTAQFEGRAGIVRHVAAERVVRGRLVRDHIEVLARGRGQARSPRCRPGRSSASPVAASAQARPPGSWVSRST